MMNREEAVAKLITLNEDGKIRIVDIANYVGVRSSSVSCWLTGVSLPAAKHMYKVEELIKSHRKTAKK